MALDDPDEDRAHRVDNESHGERDQQPGEQPPVPIFPGQQPVELLVNHSLSLAAGADSPAGRIGLGAPAGFARRRLQLA
jgi:hypothetical protein